MSYSIRDGLTYDDVLLVPQYSEIKSRSEIDVSVNLNNFKYKHPIVVANMKTVIGLEMATTIIQSGGLAILHRFMPLQEQLDIISNLINRFGNNNIAVSVGVQQEDKDNISAFLKTGIKIFCIDIAHGDSKHCVDMIKHIKKINNNVLVIAGNVATGTAAARLWRAGADVCKVGVGPGALCTTRIETGNGVPQLSALIEVAQVRDDMNELERTRPDNNLPRRTYYIISDGGLKAAGDIVKSLCFADMVMIGQLFAGTDQAPGDKIEINGRFYKSYVGSSTHKTSHVEGVAAMVPYRGCAENVLIKLLEGIKSGCSYQGVNNLIDLKESPQFVKITGAGLKESHPHDVVLI